MSRFITPPQRLRMIESYLKEAGWTWYRLAREMGMTQATITKMFKTPDASGYGNPRLEVLQRLARATGTTVGFWVDRESSR